MSGPLFAQKTSPSSLRDATSPIEGRLWHTGKLHRFARGSPTMGQRRRPPPAAETGRSCWGSGQQDASDSEADAGCRNPALSAKQTERLDEGESAPRQSRDREVETPAAESYNGIGYNALTARRGRKREKRKEESYGTKEHPPAERGLHYLHFSAASAPFPAAWWSAYCRSSMASPTA